MFDISPLVPEAQRTVLDAANIYFQHTRPWFIGLLVHGSAFKGGFIAGCSDIDLQLYLKDSAFESDGNLPLDLCLTIHRDLAKIDPSPFQYIQCYALPEHPRAGSNKGKIGPLPGTYHMLLGELPVPEATSHQVLEKARRSLEELQPYPFDITGHLLQHGGDRLARDVRFLCTDVWPTLYNVLTCRTRNPLDVWKLPKEDAIALLSEDEQLGLEIRVFFERVQMYYRGGQAVDAGLAVIEQGIKFLKAVKEWCSTRL